MNTQPTNTATASKTRTFDPGDGGPPYRCGVGLVILNHQGECLAFERRLHKGEWQWPQGGVDHGEEAEHAAVRELYEETGINATDVELLLKLPEPTFYVFPDYIDSQHPTEGIKYRGQRQDWFVFLYKGDTTQLRYDLTDEVEFISHRWLNPTEMPQLIVPFKRQVYETVVQALLPHLQAWLAAWQRS